MEKTLKIMLLILLVLTLILSIFVSAFVSKNIQTGKITHSLTKAICEGNSCQDYEISCKNKSVVSISPTGNIVKFSSSWQDPRSYEERNELC